ncbi:MAG TPA: hypothetical protein VLM38_25125 [Blastocatellia bacterium]|nr:hypothetical protein [Blastocatellia bacterium]
MKTTFKIVGTILVAWVAILLWSAAPSLAQVSPVEILNPRLKATEKAYLTKLVAANRAIARMKFPFILSLNRYAGLEPKDQIGADPRGLEFVNFHDRLVLKLTGNYNAAYNSDLLTPNQRSNRVFDEVIVPILQLLPNHFSPSDNFDAFGFEIAYHVRRKTRDYEYEGKEIVVVVFEKADALTYSSLEQDSKRQVVLNRADIYMDGKPFGLALGEREPFNVEALERSVGKQPTLVSAQTSVPDSASADEDTRKVRAIWSQIPLFRASSMDPPKGAVQRESQVSHVALTQADAETLQRKYQSQLDALGKEGTASFNFVDYAPPSFVVFRNQLFLQLSLRNPQNFDKDATSIYKRAARSFDLFLAPQLRAILDKVPGGAEIAGLDITIVNDLTSNSAHSSEALEFICPLNTLRQLAAAEITTQELINQSVVLVNGVRIALNLQQVE